MKLKSRNTIKVIIVALIVAGLFYAYFSVLNSRFKGNESRKKMLTVSEKVLKYPNESKRLLCNSTVYLDTEEKQKDESWNMQVLHDFEHERIQTTVSGREEIYEYAQEQLRVYSKGVSPVYLKEKGELRKLPTDRWFKYSCEPMYGWGRKSGTTDRTSYGYLASTDYLKRLYKEGQEEIDGVKYDKYIAVIRNTNKLKESLKEGDNEFRKAVSANGLDSMELRKNYPDAYKLLKGVYQKETEEVSVWVDSEGKLAFIEKDYTFPYYMSVLKENSEKIEEKVGAHGYPKVICRQTYRYSPDCAMIQIPKEFEEI